jgi:hypothetical protein
MPQNAGGQEDDDEKAEMGIFSQRPKHSSFVWLPILEYDPHISSLIPEERKKPASPNQEIKRV